MDTTTTNKSDLVVEKKKASSVKADSSSPVTATNTKATETVKAEDKVSPDKKSPKASKSKKARNTENSENGSDSSSSSESSDSESSSSSDSDVTKNESKSKKKADQISKDKKAKSQAKSKKKSKKEDSSACDSKLHSPETSSSHDTRKDNNEISLQLQQIQQLQLQQLQLLQMQGFGGNCQPMRYCMPMLPALSALPAQSPVPEIPEGPSRALLGAKLHPLHPPQLGSAAARAARRRAIQELDDSLETLKDETPKNEEKKVKRGKEIEFKRIDKVWDTHNRRFTCKDSYDEDTTSGYERYSFNVRRNFDWEGKYTDHYVDINSRLLKEALRDVLAGVKGPSLVGKTPAVELDIFFLYLEEIRKLYKDLKHTNLDVKSENKKAKTRAKRKHVKLLLQFIDKHYAATKNALYPMLKSGIITYDLLWALFKPYTIAFTTTYSTADEPRAFRIDKAESHDDPTKGKFYRIDGSYLEFDGKTFGMGVVQFEIPEFKDTKEISSLGCYPLIYHKNAAKLRDELIERGKKFVSLGGVHYRSHEGLAYVKQKKQVAKIHVSGRIMIDPAIHRRYHPSYNVSTVKPSDSEAIKYNDDSDSDSDKSSDSDDDGQEDAEDLEDLEKDDDAPETKKKLVAGDFVNGAQEYHLVSVDVDTDGEEIVVEKFDKISSQVKKGDGAEGDKKVIPTFTDEEYLIASPVVLGFAFTEKTWLEFTVSGVKDIEWNEGAYESLVLEENTKSIVKALVESHKYHASESIDDVIRGKGKGLVTVLHGPPGTGKTLTAEGIAELLKCPLYMVSVGELGTDPTRLERQLQRVLDTAHAWGAVLLLDEADVFMEARTLQDVNRNALVSIFLRLLEYYQGILFLTTNRVGTFDDAFQSRIHVALRYGALTTKAKKTIFKAFIERVRVMEGTETMPFTEDDYDSLSRNELNGRQIKNIVRTSQALAVNSKEPLSMVHVKRVLDVSKAFDRDLKGGPGFEDAMRGYF